jgi:hypothetical protein
MFDVVLMNAEFRVMNRPFGVTIFSKVWKKRLGRFQTLENPFCPLLACAIRRGHELHYH